MAKYKITTHQLAFDNLFKNLIVTPEEGNNILYSLTGEGIAIQLKITELGDYWIKEVAIPLEPKIAVEHHGNETLEFNQAILGGTVVIDLRDMGRYGNPDSLNNKRCEATFALGGTPHVFWTTTSGKGFKIYFENEYCHELILQ